MGRLQTEEVMAMADANVALHFHLRSNHFPPIIDGEEFAKLAIEAVNEGDHGRMIDDGSRRGYARDVVESWHLDFFLEGDDEL